MPLIPNHKAEDSCLKNHPIPASDLEKDAFHPPPDGNQPSSDDQNRENSTDDAADEYPEGGLKAWLVVVGSCLYLFLVFFVGVLVGPVFDRFGPRLLVAGGCFLIVLSLMILGLSNTFYQTILTYSVLGGLGGALLNAPAYSAIAHFFHARRGLATGVASTAGGIGGTVLPLLLRHLLGQNGVGFAWSCRIMGFIMLGLAVPDNLFIKSRKSAKMRNADQRKVSSVWPDFSIFRDPRFALASVGYFFMEIGLFVPLTYIISYATSYGMSTSDSFLLLSFLNAGSVVGRFLPGFLADIFGRLNVIIITIALCVVTVLGIWLPCDGSRGVLITFAVTFGVASGSNLSLIPIICVAITSQASDQSPSE
ncbi:hypothetical protein H9Q70_009091 [Fusarium xylarioides]|nr:hypothetical protein H9Q70_009091 [Fusarium xylarioides]